ncbi:hypothetical protein N9J26_00080 [bacterium]|nr:hypothetical protein [bacterium]
MKKVLHLSHTDIRSDSRILKEMSAIASTEYQVLGVGVNDFSGTEEASLLENNFSIFNINLLSRKMVFLPRTLRHVITLIELTFKMLFKGLFFKPNIIHCHDTLVLPLGVILKTFTRSSLIYDAHELESDRNGLTKFQGKLTKLVEKLCWPSITALIVVSSSIESWYLREFSQKKNLCHLKFSSL